MLVDAVFEIVMILDEKKRERKPRFLYLAEFAGPTVCSEPGIKHRVKGFRICVDLSSTRAQVVLGAEHSPFLA